MSQYQCQVSCVYLAQDRQLALQAVQAVSDCVCMRRLRDLESPKPSSSATPITPAATTAQRRNNSTHQLQRQTKPVLHSATIQRDRQSTTLARQRSGPDRKRETAEEAKLREAVMSEVLDIKPSESWNDIAGLDGAKQVHSACCRRHSARRYDEKVVKAQALWLNSTACVSTMQLSTVCALDNIGTSVAKQWRVWYDSSGCHWSAHGFKRMHRPSTSRYAFA